MELDFKNYFDVIIYYTLKTEFLAVAVFIIGVLHYFFIYKSKRLSEISLDVTNYLVLSIIATFSANKFEMVNQAYKFRLFDLGYGVFTLISAFILCDFIFYFFHRLEHRWPFLWSIHQVHHSSLDISYSTALRVPWILFFITPLYYAPLLLFGFNPLLIVFFKKMIMTYQFFMHRPVQRKDSWWGKILITPQIHTVHHLADPRFHNKNFGGMLSIWDRMFGTYIDFDEKAEAKYGSGGPVYKDPFSLNFMPIYDWAKKKFSSSEAA